MRNGRNVRKPSHPLHSRHHQRRRTGRMRNMGKTSHHRQHGTETPAKIRLHLKHKIPGTVQFFCSYCLHHTPTKTHTCLSNHSSAIHTVQTQATLFTRSFPLISSNFGISGMFPQVNVSKCCEPIYCIEEQNISIGTISTTVTYPRRRELTESGVSWSKTG